MNLEVMLQSGWTTERLCANETINVKHLIWAVTLRLKYLSTSQTGQPMKLYVVFHNLPRPENIPSMGTVVFPIIIETFAYCVTTLHLCFKIFFHGIVITFPNVVITPIIKLSYASIAPIFRDITII